MVLEPAPQGKLEEAIRTSLQQLRCARKKIFSKKVKIPRILRNNCNVSSDTSS